MHNSDLVFTYFLTPLDTVGTEQKVHSSTNNLEELQKVMVKYCSWKINAWNALLFEKTLYTDLIFKHMSWHGETCENKGGFSCYFLPTLKTDWA